MNLNKKIIQAINKFLLNHIKPDFTVLNIVSNKTLIKRLKKRKNKNRYDSFKIPFYNNVQKGFIKIAKNKNGYLLINSDFNLNYNKKLVLKKINHLIK